MGVNCAARPLCQSSSGLWGSTLWVYTVRPIRFANAVLACGDRPCGCILIHCAAGLRCQRSSGLWGPTLWAYTVRPARFDNIAPACGGLPCGCTLRGPPALPKQLGPVGTDPVGVHCAVRASSSFDFPPLFCLLSPFSFPFLLYAFSFIFRLSSSSCLVPFRPRIRAGTQPHEYHISVIKVPWIFRGRLPLPPLESYRILRGWIGFATLNLLLML